jgi:hypothetical protein
MATKRKGYMTLAEHHAQLKAEGKWDEYVARKQEREEALRRREDELTQAEAPLVQALAAVGLEVKSVWDLVKRATRHYPEAVPVLLDHLQRPYPDAIRDGIARALTVDEARCDWEVLTRLYREERQRRTKDGLAVAISGIATDDVIGDVIALARNRKHGTSRGLLLSALERSKDPRARQALMELGTDPELQKEIQLILRRRKRAGR